MKQTFSAVKQTIFDSKTRYGFYWFSIILVALFWGIIFTFNNDEALKKFRAAKGWEAGVDGNVALFTVGGGQKSLVAMNENPVLAFVFDVKGLIADISMKGAKFNKLDLSK